MLNLVGVDNDFFLHSKQLSQGAGKVRVGQATKIVALDGTGDFDNIQDAINDLPSEGGVVYVKEGTYIIDKEISVVKNNVMIKGAGTATIIKIKNNANIRGLNVSGDNFTVSDCMIDGNKTEQSGGTEGIKLSGTNNNIVGVKITNHNSIGINMNGSKNKLIRCVIDNNNASGVYFDFGCVYSMVMLSLIENNGLHGIFFPSSYNYYSIVTGNIILNNTDTGVKCYADSDWIKIHGNLLKGNGTAIALGDVNCTDTDNMKA